MEDSQTKDSANKLEVSQMLGIDFRCRVDLEVIVVMGRVFKKTIERVTEFL